MQGTIVCCSHDTVINHQEAMALLESLAKVVSGYQNFDQLYPRWRLIGRVEYIDNADNILEIKIPSLKLKLGRCSRKIARR